MSKTTYFILLSLSASSLFASNFRVIDEYTPPENSSPSFSAGTNVPTTSASEQNIYHLLQNLKNYKKINKIKLTKFQTYDNLIQHLLKTPDYDFPDDKLHSLKLSVEDTGNDSGILPLLRRQKELLESLDQGTPSPEDIEKYNEICNKLAEYEQAFNNSANSIGLNGTLKTFPPTSVFDQNDVDKLNDEVKKFTLSFNEFKDSFNETVIAYLNADNNADQVSTINTINKNLKNFLEAIKKSQEEITKKLSDLQKKIDTQKTWTDKALAAAFKLFHGNSPQYKNGNLKSSAEKKLNKIHRKFDIIKKDLPSAEELFARFETINTIRNRLDSEILSLNGIRVGVQQAISKNSFSHEFYKELKIKSTLINQYFAEISKELTKIGFKKDKINKSLNLFKHQRSDVIKNIFFTELLLKGAELHHKEKKIFEGLTQSLSELNVDKLTKNEANFTKSIGRLVTDFKEHYNALKRFKTLHLENNTSSLNDELKTSVDELFKETQDQIDYLTNKKPEQFILERNLHLLHSCIQNFVNNYDKYSKDGKVHQYEDKILKIAELTNESSIAFNHALTNDKRVLEGKSIASIAELINNGERISKESLDKLSKLQKSYSSQAITLLEKNIIRIKSRFVNIKKLNSRLHLTQEGLKNLNETFKELNKIKNNLPSVKFSSQLDSKKKRIRELSRVFEEEAQKFKKTYGVSTELMHLENKFRSAKKELVVSLQRQQRIALPLHNHALESYLVKIEQSIRNFENIKQTITTHKREVIPPLFKMTLENVHQYVQELKTFIANPDQNTINQEDLITVTNVLGEYTDKLQKTSIPNGKGFSQKRKRNLNIFKDGLQTVITDLNFLSEKLTQKLSIDTPISSHPTQEELDRDHEDKRDVVGKGKEIVGDEIPSWVALNQRSATIKEEDEEPLLRKSRKKDLFMASSSSSTAPKEDEDQVFDSSEIKRTNPHEEQVSRAEAAAHQTQQPNADTNLGENTDDWVLVHHTVESGPPASDMKIEESSKNLPKPGRNARRKARLKAPEEAKAEKLRKEKDTLRILKFKEENQKLRDEEIKRRAKYTKSNEKEKTTRGINRLGFIEGNRKKARLQEEEVKRLRQEENKRLEAEKQRQEEENRRLIEAAQKELEDAEEARRKEEERQAQQEADRRTQEEERLRREETKRLEEERETQQKARRLQALQEEEAIQAKEAEEEAVRQAANKQREDEETRRKEEERQVREQLELETLKQEAEAKAAHQEEIRRQEEAKDAERKANLDAQLADELERERQEAEAEAARQAANRQHEAEEARRKKEERQAREQLELERLNQEAEEERLRQEEIRLQEETKDAERKAYLEAQRAAERERERQETEAEAARQAEIRRHEAEQKRHKKLDENYLLKEYKGNKFLQRLKSYGTGFEDSLKAMYPWWSPKDLSSNEEDIITPTVIDKISINKNRLSAIRNWLKMAEKKHPIVIKKTMNNLMLWAKERKYDNNRDVLSKRQLHEIFTMLPDLFKPATGINQAKFNSNVYNFLSDMKEEQAERKYGVWKTPLPSLRGEFRTWVSSQNFGTTFKPALNRFAKKYKEMDADKYENLSPKAQWKFLNELTHYEKTLKVLDSIYKKKDSVKEEKWIKEGLEDIKGIKDKVVLQPLNSEEDN